MGLSIAIGVTWSIIELIRISRMRIDELPDGAKARSIELMREVSEAIASGATAFLVEEYKWLSMYIVVFFVLIYLFVSIPAAVAFVVGALTSCACGFIGMKTAVMCNVRTAYACWTDLSKGFDVAIRGGSVMGLLLVSLGLFCLAGLMAGFDSWLESKPEKVFEALAGYGLGGSSIALFARVGGGIYTKAADVGADLSGKNEYGMDEDDPRNPACIADNVGDNVGDIAGMGADLFGSFAESTCASLILLSHSDSAANLDVLGKVYMYPVLISAAGIIVSFISILAIRFGFQVTSLDRIERALKYLLVLSTVLMIPAIFGLSYFCLYNQELVLSSTVTLSAESGWIRCAGAVTAGLVSGLLIGIVTEFYTSHSYTPVREIAETQRVSAATGIIFGLSWGYYSCIIPALLLTAVMVGSKLLAGMFGVSLAALGMLSTMSVGLCIDAYGPISDNAGGIAEMSELGPEVRQRTDGLDAAGNTTAAIGKGFAIGSAALVSLSLFGAFCTKAEVTHHSLDDNFTFAGLVLGALMPFAFSAMTMKAVGVAAQDMVKECMRQFPDIVAGRAKPDYERCVSISTRASVAQMVAPGVLVLGSPVVAALLLGKNGVAGLLAGSLVSGVMLAISMSNTGGAWDNAKKYIETGVFGSEHAKGSATHKNAVIGDTVGDPLKDTSGPSLNILVKLSAITSVLFAGVFKKWSNEQGGPSYA